MLAIVDLATHRAHFCFTWFERSKTFCASLGSEQNTRREETRPSKVIVPFIILKAGPRINDLSNKVYCT